MKEKKMALNFFSKYVLPPLIFTIGFFGNILGLLSILIYKLVFITDSIYLCIFKF